MQRSLAARRLTCRDAGWTLGPSALGMPALESPRLPQSGSGFAKCQLSSYVVRVILIVAHAPDTPQTPDSCGGEPQLLEVCAVLRVEVDRLE